MRNSSAVRMTAEEMRRGINLMVLIQPEYFYSQEYHLMDRGYQVLACDSILENRSPVSGQP